MAKTIVVKPLGLVLRKAGLVSSEQIEKALKESLNLPRYKLGEILAIRGWIKPETADFFAETWPRILAERSNNLETTVEELTHHNLYFPHTDNGKGLQTPARNVSKNSLFAEEAPQNRTPNRSNSFMNRSIFQRVQPLGQYLKAASLINDQQIIQILKIQQNLKIKHNKLLKFGKIAVEQQIISQTTLEFFLEHLNLIKTGEKINMYPETVALELDSIENYLLNNQKCEPVKLLQKYDQLRQQGKIFASGDLLEQELIASGIAVLEDNIIRIAKLSYQENFNEDWLEKELANLQPYNQIRLKMFDLDNKAGISYKILNAVNYWTNHQPFLSQKLYLLIQEKLSYIPPGKEETVIEELTYKHIIDDWQNGVAKEHFQAIKERIFQNEYCTPYDILQTYKKILKLKETNANNSLEQTQLLRLGLIKLHNSKVSISNLIYEAVFDRQWIAAQLSSIEQPLSSTNNKVSANSSKNSSRIVANNSSYSHLTKYLLPILGIIAFLIAVFVVVKSIERPSKNEKSIRQENIFLEHQYLNFIVKI